MKFKEFFWAILLNAFLGYLWVLFIDHIIGVVNLLDQVFLVGGFIILIGSILFWEILKRVTPFNEEKFTHPIKITGFVSFGTVVVIHLFAINII